MKRILAVVLAVVMVVSLAACGNEQTAGINCTSCGGSISAEARFCEHCGTKVNATNESEDASSDNISSYNTSSISSEESKPVESSKPTEPSKPTESQIVKDLTSYYDMVNTRNIEFQKVIYEIAEDDEYRAKIAMRSEYRSEHIQFSDDLSAITTERWDESIHEFRVLYKYDDKSGWVLMDVIP